jgi:hypothetical protein
VGSGGVFRGERSELLGDSPAVGGEKNFLCVCVGGREERREDVDEGRSGDWLKIGEISKKKVKNLYIGVWCSSVSVREFFHPPLRRPHSAPHPGLQL